METALSPRPAGPPTDATGAPVRDGAGRPITYDNAQVTAATQNARVAIKPATAVAATGGVDAPVSDAPSQPVWQYSIFGSGIGASNIIIAPLQPGETAPQIILGGNSRNDFGGDNFWQILRYNGATGNYDQLFVSRIYSGDFSVTISRIVLADVTGDAAPEIVVMLTNGRILFYDFASRAEIGQINTGFTYLNTLALADLDGDGHPELITVSTSDLLVFDLTGKLLWRVNGAGGYDVVVGQMDNDPALEIATTSGKVIDGTTHVVEWDRAGGFGYRLKLAPFPGENYQQLIAGEAWNHIYGYDIARHLPRWSIDVFNLADIEVADVDGDGVADLLLGDAQWGSIHVYDLLTQTEKWSTGNPEHGVTRIAAGDVDGDGVTDLVWGAGYSDTGPDYLYVGDTVSHAIKWQSIDLQGPFVGPAIGDLDGDGLPELVVCSMSSDSGYGSGRILVFDPVTLSLRAASPPVVNNRAWTGVHDLKLRDVDGDGGMEIVIGASDLYDGAIEIYRFDANGAFTRTWTNTQQPDGSPFSRVEVADLDGSGHVKILGVNSISSSGSPGTYLYIYDYPSGALSWQSVNLANTWAGGIGLMVSDVDGNGSREIVALVSSGDLYTWDAASLQLRNLTQRTGFTALAARIDSLGLVGTDANASPAAHFLQYANDTYSESFLQPLGSGVINGINPGENGAFWVGRNGQLELRHAPSFQTVDWQSADLGNNPGYFVATDARNGQYRVFTSNRNGLVAFNYGAAPVFHLTTQANNGEVSQIPGDGDYTVGRKVQLTAAAIPGYEFSGWSGDLSGTANPAVVTMDADKNVVANFTPIPRYTITVGAAPSVGGTVAGGGTFLRGTHVVLTATPNAGYNFANWTENGTIVSTDLSYEMNATSDRALVANFVAFPMVSLSATTTTIKKTGQTIITVHASTVNPSQPIQVWIALTGTAQLGWNYTLSDLSGSVTIPPGQSSATITLTGLTNPAKKTQTAIMTILDQPGYVLSPVTVSGKGKKKKTTNPNQVTITIQAK